jgi:hypothetical protein
MPAVSAAVLGGSGMARVARSAWSPAGAQVEDHPWWVLAWRWPGRGRVGPHPS